MTPTRPDVYGYLDYQRFLLDWHAWYQRRRPGFTRAQWAAKAKLSKAGLHYILAGDRVPVPRSAEAVAGAMDLDADEQAYFLRICDLASSPTWQDRGRRLAALFADPSFRGALQLTGSTLAYISRWYFVAIREMASFPDFVADARRIQERLIAPLPLEAIEDALATLLDLQLLERRADGTIGPSTIQTTTPVDATGSAAYDHHRQALEMALLGLDVVPPADRAYLVATLGVPAQALASLRSELWAFAQRIGAETDAAPGDRREVYQFSVQLFPLTRRPGANMAPLDADVSFTEPVNTESALD